MALSPKLKKYALTLLLTLTCAGCSFQLQHAQDLPSCLSTVYIKKNEFFDYGLNLALKNYFQGMQATITESQQSSPLTIALSNVKFHNTSAALSSGSNAITNTYYAQASLTIFDAHNQKIAGPNVFSTSHTISQNSAIINTSAKTQQINRELTRTLTTSMITWINSPPNIKAFQQATEQNHAN